MAIGTTPRRDGLGQANGVGKGAFDRWFRYPAGFSQVVLGHCFESLTPSLHIVIDPFAGVASVGTYATMRGGAFVGIEAHPEIAELANLKFAATPDAEEIRMAARRVVIEGGDFNAENETELVRSSFDETTLRRLIGIRDRIVARPRDASFRPLKWALLASLRDCASVKVGWPYQRPGVTREPRIADPVRAFLRRVDWIVEDGSINAARGPGSVLVGDARKESVWKALTVVPTAVVSSPPYLNNYDYADATRLESYFWGVARSWKDLTSVVRSDMIAGSTQQTTRVGSEDALKDLASLVPRTLATIGDITAKLGRARSERPRGKEYDQLVPMYFRDIARVIERIRDNVQPGSPLILVLGDSAPYGVYIDTPRLVSDVAVELGLSLDEVRNVRQRGLRWHTNGTRHAVALRESVVRLRTPGITPQ